MEGMKKATIAKIVLVIALAALCGGCKPEMPVSVSFRNALVGKSLVAQIHNNSNATMKIVVEVSSPTTGETKKAEFVIGGKEMKEFGWAEGWQFVSGESIRIHNADYADLKVKVP
jgi:ribosomal protein L10